VGQDGLVANILKYLDGQPLVGVNPDPELWDGVLLPFKPENAARIVEETVLGRRKFEEVTMASAKVQNGQELLAVNDFFIGQRGHASARYIIKYSGIKEPQSSSGVIVSTGLGSTGWMKSIIAGANRISSSVIGRPYGSRQESGDLLEEDEEPAEEPADEILECQPIMRCSISMEDASVEEDMDIEYSPDFDREPEFEDRKMLMEAKPVVPAPSNFLFKKRPVLKKKEYGPSDLANVVGKWSSTELLFAVREPFPSKTTGTNLIFGKVGAGETLRIESLMGENGIIFSDGIESDFIDFNSGTEAVITLAGKKGRMVV
jgi:hypothetical protein